MPTSVLWVTLIAVWLFVVVPMVLRGRPQARKVTQAAAETRLVHRGGASRRAGSSTAARTRAARRAAETSKERAAERERRAQERAAKAKERAEAAAKAAAEAAEAEAVETEVDETEVDETRVDEIGVAETGDDGTVVAEAVVVDDAAVEDLTVDADAEDDAEIVDAEIVEDETVADESGNSDRVAPLEGADASELTDQIPVVETDDVVDLDHAQARATQRVGRDFDEVHSDELLEDDLADEDYLDDEYADDLDDEAADDLDDILDEDIADEDGEPELTARDLRGRGGYGPDRLAEREEMQYRERRRVLASFAVLTFVAIVSAFFFQPWGIVAAVMMIAAFGCYLVFLRRAVRAEQERAAVRAARRRRQQEQDARFASRREEPTYVEPPTRLRRPGGAVVLELDDEDPAFDYLPTYDFGGAAGFDDDVYGEERRYSRTAV